MLLIKLLLILVVAVVVAQAQSMMAWCFVAVPVIYLIWRLEPSRG